MESHDRPAAPRRREHVDVGPESAMETPMVESVADGKTIALIEVSPIEIPIATPVKTPLRSPDVVTAADVTATDPVPAITADFATIAAANLAAIAAHLGASAAVATAGHIPATLNGCAAATLNGGATAATTNITAATATNGCTAAATAATNGRTAASAAAATRAAVLLGHHHARCRKQRNGGQARKNFCTHLHVLLQHWPSSGKSPSAAIRSRTNMTNW
jgi:hypothetical protein